MLITIQVNAASTEAILTYPDGHKFSLYDSSGNVQNLIRFFTLPSVPKDLNLQDIEKVYQSSLEDTDPCLKVA